MNRQNLALMPPFIRTIPQDKFDMMSFREGQQVTPECDSVGCVIGHCTVLDPKPLPMLKDGDIDFWIWAYEFTGLNGDNHEWCFSLGWIHSDNTTEGAALRIEWLLKNGLPEDWSYQMNGFNPLCYKP